MTLSLRHCKNLLTLAGVDIKRRGNIMGKNNHAKEFKIFETRDEEVFYYYQCGMTPPPLEESTARNPLHGIRIFPTKTKN